MNLLYCPCCEEGILSDDLVCKVCEESYLDEEYTLDEDDYERV